jgi:hypothetical protein
MSAAALIPSCPAALCMVRELWVRDASEAAYALVYPMRDGGCQIAMDIKLSSDA